MSINKQYTFFLILTIPWLFSVYLFMYYDDKYLTLCMIFSIIWSAFIVYVFISGILSARKKKKKEKEIFNKVMSKIKKIR